MGGGGFVANTLDKGVKGVSNAWDRNKGVGGDLLTLGSVAGATGLVAKKSGEKYINDKTNRAEGDALVATQKNDAIIQDMKNAEMVSEETKKRDQNRAKQRMLAQAQGGRAGTLLTSPLGVTDSYANGRKTLLGQ